MLWQPQHCCSRFTPAAALGNLPALPKPFHVRGGLDEISLGVAAPCLLLTLTPAFAVVDVYLSLLRASTSKSKGSGRRSMWLQTCAVVTPAAYALLYQLLRLCLYQRLQILTAVSSVRHRGCGRNKLADRKKLRHAFFQGSHAAAS